MKNLCLMKLDAKDYFKGIFKYNLFQVYVPLIYPMRTSDNLWFYGFFRDYRSSYWMYSMKKFVLKNFAKFTGKHVC